MSRAARDWAYSLPPLPKGCRFLLVTMAGYTKDKEHQCWLGNDELARLTDSNERTVRRQLEILESMHLLTRKHRHSPSGYRMSDEIVLCVGGQPTSKPAPKPVKNAAPTGQNARISYRTFLPLGLPDIFDTPTGHFRHAYRTFSTCLPDISDNPFLIRSGIDQEEIKKRSESEAKADEVLNVKSTPVAVDPIPPAPAQPEHQTSGPVFGCESKKPNYSLSDLTARAKPLHEPATPAELQAMGRDLADLYRHLRGSKCDVSHHDPRLIDWLGDAHAVHLMASCAHQKHDLLRGCWYTPDEMHLPTRTQILEMSA